MKALHIASFMGNIGDNANHLSARKVFTDVLGKSIDWHELEIRKAYQNYKHPDRLIFDESFAESANNYDLVMIGGGNFFELWLDDSQTGTTVDISVENLKKIKVPVLFHALGFDIHKGYRPQNKEKFQQFAQAAHAMPNIYLTLRNDGSYQNVLTALGQEFIDFFDFIPDPGFFFEAHSKHDLFEKNDSITYIGINLACDMNDLRFTPQYSFNDFIQDFAGEIDSLLQHNPGFQIILFPHIYSDLYAISDFIKHLSDPVRRARVLVCPYIQGNQGAHVIFSAYRQCAVILGMRFHANVCGFGMGIPTIGLGSYPKLFDLYQELHFDDRCVNIRRPEAIPEIHTLILDSIKHRMLIKNDYQQRKFQMLEQLRALYQRIIINNF